MFRNIHKRQKNIKKKYQYVPKCPKTYNKNPKTSQNVSQRPNTVPIVSFLLAFVPNMTGLVMKITRLYN